MKTVMLHMKIPEDLAEAAEGKDLKTEVSAALRDRWFPAERHPSLNPLDDYLQNLAVAEAAKYPTYGSIPAEQKQPVPELDPMSYESRMRGYEQHNMVRR